MDFIAESIDFTTPAIEPVTWELQSNNNTVSINHSLRDWTK